MSTLGVVANFLTVSTESMVVNTSTSTVPSLSLQQVRCFLFFFVFFFKGPTKQKKIVPKKKAYNIAAVFFFLTMEL